MAPRRAPLQLDLPKPKAKRTHGGRRAGAGRPRRSGESVPHARRPDIDTRHPLHVTLRVRPGVWNLRSQRGFATVEAALRAERHRVERVDSETSRVANERPLRIVHYTVQGNHLHLVVEADSARTLSRRMQGFAIRFARAVNRMMGRPRGRVLAERYHARALKTPTEVRNTIRYVLLNHVKHTGQAGRVGITVDPYSSGPWFTGWPRSTRIPEKLPCTGPPPIVDAKTFLLSEGWRRARGPFVEA